MVIEDMRHGRCGACGMEDIFQAEVAGEVVVRAPGRNFGKNTVFHAFICGACGHVQCHMALDDKRRRWLVQASPCDAPVPPPTEVSGHHWPGRRRKSPHRPVPTSCTPSRRWAAPS